jgi:DNA-binding beta-propeller fold protein YncE
MKRIRWNALGLFGGAAILLAGVAPSAAQVAETPSLVLEHKIVLGEVKGRIDHMALDPVRSRLFVAELENNSVGIVDLKERKVAHVITNLKEPQGVGFEPSTDTLYVTNAGDGSVRLFRGADYADAGRVDLGDDADNVRMDVSGKRVLIGYGGGAIAAIDPATRGKITSFPLPAHPEGFQFDPATNQIFVNVPRSRTIVVLDGRSGLQKGAWPLKEAGGNFPMELDEGTQRVLVAFRSPARLGAFSIGTGQSVANIELCGDADDLFVDPKRSRLYVSCGQGYLDIFDTRDGGYRRVARLPTAPGARTSYFVPSIDRLFLAVRTTSAEPAAIWVFRPLP